MLYRRIETHPTLRLARDIADQEIHDVLARFGNSAEAAYALGISISALRPRLKKLSVRD
jgi:transcriptional regulator with PAS, ATPase and Fis domain